MNYNPQTFPKYQPPARDLEAVMTALAQHGEARILAADLNRIRAGARRRGYKWSFKRDGRYCKVTSS